MKDGGPAFPNGASLRDCFAGWALPGVMAKHRWVEDTGLNRKIVHMGSPIEIAINCYKIADATLAVREKRA